jgi:hypothetical protein
VGSIPIARSTSRLASGPVGHEIEVNTLILWESGGNGRRFGGGLVSWHIPKLPHYSHVQSHAASLKNNVCDSHTLCTAAMAIACGRTRPSPAGGERQVSGSSIRSVFSRRYTTGSGALTASCPLGSRAGSVIKSKDTNAMAAPNIM